MLPTSAPTLGELGSTVIDSYCMSGLQSAGLARCRRLQLGEIFGRGGRDDFAICGGHWRLEQVEEFRPDARRNVFQYCAVLLDAAPLANEVEAVGVDGVAAEHAV